MSMLHKIVGSLAMALSLGVVHAQLLQDQEIRAQIQQWTPGSKTLKASGKSYELAADVQWLDRQARFVSPQAARAGVPVLLLLSEGQVTHVIVNPGPYNPFERPGGR
ncbi:MAG: hypothetical protein AB1455_05710 [Pseudomonadota bacterium]